MDEMELCVFSKLPRKKGIGGVIWRKIMIM